MAQSKYNWRYVLLFLSCLSLSLAATPTSFCKCTCFSNSTIIPLDDSPNTTSIPSSDNEPATPVHRRTCNDCTKKFCLEYHLPICEGAEDTDVFTTCFQRDSTKDELVVFIFIIATVGLLAWATVKPWVQRLRDNAHARHPYAPVMAAEGNQEQ